jgi:dimethylsulfone monooxygenase
MHTTNAMREDNGFKLGVFAYSYEGGNAITTVPERWSCRWPEIRQMIQLADRSGLDFLLPAARWRGIPGAVNNRLWSFETLTLAAATAAITDRIGVFSTVHTPIIHPIVAAKAMATIDHVSGGRAGVNIVCGWNKADFLMFGIPELPHDERYVQGQAAYSPAGRDFAIRTSDYLLTVAESAETGRAEIAQLADRSAKAGRETPPGCIAVAYVVCRETREEAEAFHQYYAVDNADHAGVDYYISTRKGQAVLPQALYNELRARMAAGNGGYPLVGSPEDVAEGIKDLHRAGFQGAALIFLNFGDELGFFVDRVLPLLEQAGVRSASTSAKA